jgi:hypothetical protein
MCKLRISRTVFAAVLAAAGLLTFTPSASAQTSVFEPGPAAPPALTRGTEAWTPTGALSPTDEAGSIHALAPLPAQPAPAGGNALSDRFQIDAGYFLIGANTVLRFDGPAGADGEVDFEEDLGVDKDATTWWVDATMRLGRRHQLKFNYTSLDRERVAYTLERSFTWGGQAYSAGLDASATTGTDIIGGYYRFAVYRDDRFEVGPTVGVGYLWLNAGIRATGTVSGPGGTESRILDEEASLGSVTGALGAYTNAWLTDRFVLRADYLYIKITPDDTEASVIDWRIGADYYFLRNVGVGVQYKHYTYGYDRGMFENQLGGELEYAGLQVFASFLF